MSIRIFISTKSAIVELTHLLKTLGVVPFLGSCALCVMSESSSGEDAQTTPPSSCRGSENGEGISSSDEVISAHPAFQQQ